MKEQNLNNILLKNNKLSNFAKDYIDYLSVVFKSLNFNQLEKLEKEMVKMRRRNSTLFAIGNGGGAATAMTISNDLGFDLLKKTKKKGFRIISLVDNSSVVTAISNDVGYENIFINQLKTHFKKQDALIIFSASGNSENLIKAAKWVKSKKGKVFSIVGFSGGSVAKISDICLHFKSNSGEYGPVEDSQLIVNHILAHWFQSKFKK